MQMLTTLTSVFSRSYHRQYTYTQDNLMITSTLMSFDKEPSPQDRHGCNCNKLWLRKAPLESWALSCVKYHLYSWSAFSSTMRKSIIKAPAYVCNSNPMKYDGILVTSWQNLGWVWTLLLYGWSINCCIDSYSTFQLFLLQRYSNRYFLDQHNLGSTISLRSSTG